MKKVIGTGETILDIIFKGGQPQKANPGGSVFNGMVSLARAGLNAVFISELSNDATGHLILDFMKENRLLTDFVQIYEDGISPVAMAFLNDNNDAEYQFFREPTVAKKQFLLPEIEEGDVVLTSSYFAVNPEMRSEVRRLLTQAKLNKALIYYDINLRRPHAKERERLMPAVLENFEFADIVRCSTEDIKLLFPDDTVKTIYSKYIDGKLFIVTDGAGDILLKTACYENYYPVETIVPVSTIGAGDNFNAGVIYFLIINNITDLKDMTETLFGELVNSGKSFAQEVCLSIENYIRNRFYM
ncbi:MAG: PfkB family carbohydrate kinase [Dysgonamonadaceae bacterium]|nr:PfkB family carbohydrate kinase [Dysgonamonadaceae bacterium]